MMGRTLLVALLVGVAAGCSASISSQETRTGNAAKSGDRTRTSGTTAARPSPRPANSGTTKTAGQNSHGDASAPKVADDAFATVEEAVEAMCRAAEERDSDARLRASGWLSTRGEAAVAALRAVLDDEQAGTASKIAACRALGRLGPPAVETLLAHLDSDDPLVRLNALDQLPHIRPPSRQILDSLIAALDHSDPRMRQKAIRGLGLMGPTAKDAAPHLQQILNAKEDETLRADAKDALKKVQPRRTLTFD
jgi:HEAT repeat protein